MVLAGYMLTRRSSTVEKQEEHVPAFKDSRKYIGSDGISIAILRLLCV